MENTLNITIVQAEWFSETMREVMDSRQHVAGRKKKGDMFVTGCVVEGNFLRNCAF